MAIAGRSYPNTPVIVRGSSEDPSDFGSKTGIIVSVAQPPAAALAVPGVTILRGTLTDPPVLTTAPPVVVAAPADLRWFTGGAFITANPQAPPLATAAVPPPVVVTSQPPAAALAVQAPAVFRNTLADPPVLTTMPPVVVAAPADRRWFSPATVVTAASPQAPAVGTPGPLVVTAQPAAAQTAVPPVTILRGTLQDPPVLTTAAPVTVAAAYDRRWFATRPPYVAASLQVPVAAQQGTAAISNTLAATATISNTLAGLVTIVNNL